MALEPDNGNYPDSRGLARALTGDRAGAIEAFRFYVDQERDPVRVAQRQAWIAALEAGQNPFDAATLWALRSQ